MFGIDKKIQKRAAKEKITEALLDCTTSGDHAYICGLADMALETGVITLNERAEYKELAAKKWEAAKKAKKEREIELAAERKRKAAEYKAKSEK
jgi:hypothetical protein